MNRLFSSMFVALICTQTFASPAYHPPGPNLTYGAVSNGQTIMSDITNPAAGAATMHKEGGTLRFGALSSIGFGFEYGDVDNLFDDLDTAAIDLSNSFINALPTAVDDSVNSINNALGAIEDDGYGKAFVSGHIPLMPLVISSDFIGGSVVFDLNFSGVVRVGAVHDSIQFSIADATTIIAGNTTGFAGDVFVDATNLANVTYDLNNDSSLLLNAAGIMEAAVGYSRHVLSDGDANLFAGVRGKLYQVSLYRDFEKVDSTQNTQNTFENFDSSDGETTTSMSVDFGLLWVSNHYRFGATLTNISEPEFDYNDVDPIKLAAAAITDPRVGALLADGLTYTMESQLTFEATLHSKNQNWLLSGSFDANEVKDPTGDKYQWATVTAAYATDNWILPGFRAGYRVNQVGSKVKYLTAGATLFKSVNLDMAYALDKVTVDGESLPRSFILNLGLELTF